MDNVYIKIDGVDYIIPIAVIGNNQILFQQNKINKIISTKNY